MAVQRGYFQGHQNMMPTGLSQVVEQFVRVGTVIALTYWMIQSGFTPGSVAAGATFGAVIGAAGGMLVMIGYNLRDRKGSPLQESDAVSSPTRARWSSLRNAFFALQFLFLSAHWCCL